MKKFGIFVAVLLIPAAALADIISSPDAAFVAVPLTYQSATSSNSLLGQPFWNHNSLDGFHINAGDFLTGSNALQGMTTNYLGSADNFGNYLSTGNPSLDASTNFNFVRNAVKANVTLLYTNAMANMTSRYGTEIGLYNVQDPSQKLVLFGHGSLYNPDPNSGGIYNNNLSPQPTSTVNPFPNYGIYATTCGYNPGGSIYCNTYYSNTGLNAASNNEPIHQHFALFQSAVDPLTYFIAFEDIRGISDTTEGYGDYNDVIFELKTTHNPEPATWTAMGLGLAGLGLLRRRRASKKG